MSRRFCAVFVSAYLLGQSALAGEEPEIVPMKKFLDVGLFEKACNGQREVDRGVCLGYIMGVADSLASPDGLFGLSACFPDAITPPLLKDLAMLQIEKHPDWSSLAAAPVVALALSNGYPCRN